MLTFLLCSQILSMIQQEDTGESRKFLVCTRDEISEISEKYNFKKSCEVKSLNMKNLDTVYSDFNITAVSCSLKENEKKSFEAKDSEGNNLFDIEISSIKSKEGYFEEIKFFKAEVAMISTKDLDDLKDDAYVVENDVRLRKKLQIAFKFIFLHARLAAIDIKSNDFSKYLEKFVIKNSSKKDITNLKLYNELIFKLNLLSFMMVDYTIFGLPVINSYDPKLFLKKSKIFSNQKLKNIIYFNMAILKEMEPLLKKTINVINEVELTKDKEKLLRDVMITEDKLKSIYENYKELNAEIVDIKVDSHSIEEFIAKKIVGYIDKYLLNRTKYNKLLRKKSSYIPIVSENSKKYNSVAQTYLTQYKLFLNHISSDEEKFILTNPDLNWFSDSQCSEMKTTDKKMKIDEIEAAIDNLLLNIVRNVQRGRQWKVKDYEESD